MLKEWFTWAKGEGERHCCYSAGIAKCRRWPVSQVIGNNAVFSSLPSSRQGPSNLLVLIHGWRPEGRIVPAWPPCRRAAGTAAEGPLVKQLFSYHNLQSSRLRQSKIDDIYFRMIHIKQCCPFSINCWLDGFILQKLWYMASWPLSVYLHYCFLWDQGCEFESNHLLFPEFCFGLPKGAVPGHTECFLSLRYNCFAKPEDLGMN